MKYLLFIGSRLGYEALKIISELNCNLQHVFIEQEHNHEHEKYYLRSIELCKEIDVPYSLNPTNKTIEEVIDMTNSYDYVMSFGYRKMIKDNVIEKAEIAALGTHFSPLPRYRGFAPLNWVLINGEEETAVNLFYLDKEVDNGDLISCRKVKINYSDDINTLYDKCLFEFGVLMKQTIPLLEKNNFTAEKQDESKATYTCARNPEDGLINWSWDSRTIYNLVRALTYPFPGAYTFLNGNKIVIVSCEEYEIPKYEGVIPGKVIKIIKDKGVVVLCGKGAILINKISLDNSGDSIENADSIITSVRITLGFN
jgi:methionyl-tRNA formyltransferase